MLVRLLSIGSVFLLLMSPGAVADGPFWIPEGVKLIGQVSAEMSDSTVDFNRPPNSPRSKTVDVVHFEDSGRLSASGHASAEGWAVLPWFSDDGNIRFVHPSGSSLTGRASGSGGAFVSGFPITQENPQTGTTENSAYFIFTAYARGSGEITGGGVYATATGAFTASANTSVSPQLGGADQYFVSQLSTGGADVLLNSKNLGGGLPAYGDSFLTFRFSARGGVQKNPFFATPTGVEPWGKPFSAAASLVKVSWPSFPVPSQLRSVHEEGAAAALASTALTDYPGGQPSLPLPYLQVDEVSVDGLSPYRLVVPVVDGYGTDFTVYAKFISTEVDGTSRGHMATGYQFSMENDTQTFKSFAIPNELQNGQRRFSIGIADMLHELNVGEVFDFTAIDPAGVREFNLLGISASAQIDAALPPTFLHGFRFVGEGTAVVIAAALGAVPEPESLTLLALAVVGFHSRWRRRHHGRRGLQVWRG